MRGSRHPEEAATPSRATHGCRTARLRVAGTSPAGPGRPSAPWPRSTARWRAAAENGNLARAEGDRQRRGEREASVRRAHQAREAELRRSRATRERTLRWAISAPSEAAAARDTAAAGTSPTAGVRAGSRPHRARQAAHASVRRTPGRPRSRLGRRSAVGPMPTPRRLPGEPAATAGVALVSVARAAAARSTPCSSRHDAWRACAAAARRRGGRRLAEGPGGRPTERGRRRRPRSGGHSLRSRCVDQVNQ